jgi:sugar phosphate isomerase/epimerase
MNYKRRDFIKISGNLAAGLVLAPMACNAMSENKDKDNKETGEKPGLFGIQLYTLRDDMPKDPKGVLKQLAGFGYKQVESYEGPMGMFWGMKNTDFKKYMDDLGMTVVSSHCDIDKDFEKKAAEAAAIGIKYLLSAWIGPQQSLDDYKKYASEFNKRGDICKKNGIRFAYHNHDYSFIPQDGQFPQDVMMQNTDASLVDYQMDIYWVVTAGQDPETWLKKYPDRFRLSHVKDRKKDALPTDKDASCDLGTGMIDFPKVLKTGKENGLLYNIVEQERYDNSTPIESAKADAEYMKKIKV